MEYPGVRLGQRGGLFDLYQYYLGGYDQATGDEGPVTTDPFPGAGGDSGDTGGLAGIDPFRERTQRDYSPEGMARRAGNAPFTFIDQGIQNFKRTFTPDRYYEYTGAFEDDDEGTIYSDDPRTTSFFDRLKTGGTMIKTPLTAILSAGRPADAIYSYGGDAMGVGSRAGLTQDEVRNMEYIESFGGVDEYGRDIYGKNVVSAFGNYEQGVKDDLNRLETQLIKNATKYGVTWDAETGKITGNKANIDNFKSMNKLMLQKYDDYSDFNEKVEKDKEIKTQNTKAMNEMTKYYDIKKQEADTTGGITENIILPMKKPTKTEQLITQLDQSSSNILSNIDKAKKQTDRAIETLDKATAPAKIPAAQAAANREDRRSSQYSSPSRSSASSASRAGGGSRQAKSGGQSPGGAGSTTGWGWKDGGLVRKPYSDGGIVDLL